eukprot:6994741-Pyramimonas_sp.AAC.1
MGQDSLRQVQEASRRPPRRSQMLSEASVDPPPQEANICQKPEETNVVLPSCFFAPDGLLRPQDGPMTVQDSPKGGPKGAQDGPKSARERPKSGPRGPQDGSLEPTMGGARIKGRP